MTVRADRRTISIGAALLVVAATVAVLVLATRGPASGSVEGFRSALHPVDVMAAESALRRSAREGAPPARLLALTNQLLDLIRDDSAGDRRAAIDEGLAAVTGYGCPVCEDALERARP